jgi:hypothetical protein
VNADISVQPLSAKSGREQSQHRSQLFDHFVGAQKERRRRINA